MKKKVVETLLVVMAIVTVSLCGCGQKDAGEEPKEVAQAEQGTAEDASADASSQEKDNNEAGKSDGSDATASATGENASELEAAPELTKQLTNEELEAIYMEFLNDEREMVVAAKGQLWLGEEQRFTFSTMDKALALSLQDEWNQEFLQSSAEYAFIDCGDDGVTDFALKQTYDNDWESMELISVFVYKNNELQCVSMTQGYYRSYVSINRYGVINYGGSGGAASYYNSLSAVNADGEEVFLYSVDTEMALEEPYINYYSIPSDVRPADYPDSMYATSDRYYTTMGYSFNQSPNYSNDGDWEKKENEYLKTIFYTFCDEDDKDAAPSSELAAVYDRIGIKYYTMEQADQLVKEHLESLGVTEKMSNGEDPEWHSMMAEGIGSYTLSPQYSFDFVTILPGNWMMSNASEEIDSMYLAIDETMEYQIDVRFTDKYKAPGYVKGHIDFVEPEQYATYENIVFYAEETNFSDVSVRDWLGSYKMDSYKIANGEAQMILSGVGNLLNGYCTSETPEFVKTYTVGTQSVFSSIANPSDDYYTLEDYPEGSHFTVTKLKQTSCVENDITDTDRWFAQVGMQNPGLEYSDDQYTYRLGGTESYGTLTRLYIYDKAGKNLIHTYDFHDFMYAEGYEYNGFVDRSIRYALVKNGILYVNLYHSTYASSCPYNAYVMAIDLEYGTVLWKSQPLVSNSGNFVFVGDDIITGYGFSAEDHYLAILDSNTGELRDKITIKKSPDYFHIVDNTLYVRTYSYDYEFEIIPGTAK